jgi:D-serine deaminase-like pyridoxal phosphate-dependent protein
VDLHTLNTPAALIDVGRMQHNIGRMQAHLDALGVRFRPHVKTTKSTQVVDAQIAAGAQGITVSTLKEAEQFFAHGIRDIVYAVGMVPSKLGQALALRRQGCDLKLVADSLPAAHAIAEFGRAHGERFEVWIEVDVDGHRSGIPPDADLLIDVGRALADGGMVLGGVLAHAGSSYEYSTPDALAAIAEQERSRTVRAAERLRAAGLPCPVVSIGSTPTALAAEHLEGVTEVRAGVYVMFDLVMHNIGVCDLSDIALSVLTTVIGHQEEHAAPGARLRLRAGLHRTRRRARRLPDERRQPGARDRIARGHARRRHRAAVSDRHPPAHPAESRVRHRGAASRVSGDRRRRRRADVAALLRVVSKTAPPRRPVDSLTICPNLDKI